MIKTADWIIDRGPEAWPGHDPGAATAAASKPALGLDPRVAAETAEDIVREKRSYTGPFLKPVLARRGERGKPRKRVEAAE